MFLGSLDGWHSTVFRLEMQITRCDQRIAAQRSRLIDAADGSDEQARAAELLRLMLQLQGTYRRVADAAGREARRSSWPTSNSILRLSSIAALD